MEYYNMWVFSRWTRNSVSLKKIENNYTPNLFSDNLQYWFGFEPIWYKFDVYPKLIRLQIIF